MIFAIRPEKTTGLTNAKWVSLAKTRGPLAVERERWVEKPEGHACVVYAVTWREDSLYVLMSEKDLDTIKQIQSVRMSLFFVPSEKIAEACPALLGVI